MLGLFEGSAPKPKKGAVAYAQPSETSPQTTTSPTYVVDGTGRAYTADELKRLPAGYTPGASAVAISQGAAVAEPYSIPRERRGFPKLAIYGALAAATALATVSLVDAFGTRVVLNRYPKTAEKPATIQAVQQPANVPTLVAEPGFRVPLAPTPIAVPQPTATRTPYQPLGNSVTVASGQVIIDCPQICTDQELKEYAANVTTVYDSIKMLFGRPPERQLIMGVRTLQNRTDRKDRNNSITLGSYPANPDNPDYQYFMSLTGGDENGHLADELSGWMIADLVGDSKRWFLEAGSRWFGSYIASGAPANFNLRGGTMERLFTEAREGRLNLNQHYDVHYAAMALIDTTPSDMRMVLDRLGSLKNAQGYMTDEDIKTALISVGGEPMREKLNLIQPVIERNEYGP